MGSIGDVNGWVAIGAAGLALASMLVAVCTAIRSSRRARQQRREHFVELGEALERLRDTFRDERGARERAELDAESARGEADRLRQLRGIAAEIELESVLRQALASATTASGAPAAMIVVEGENGRSCLATSGLSNEEAGRPLISLPSKGDPRAATIEYAYTEEELASDAFRLRVGVVVPLRRPEAAPVGTLAVFWRRPDYSALEPSIQILEDLAATLMPALDNARRLDEATRVAELDVATGLPNRQSFRTRLVAECGRARRYDRRLTLVLLSLSGGDLRAAADLLRRVIRTADVPAHLGEGIVGVLLPEVGRTDAQPFLERLRFLFGVVAPADIPASVVELMPEDDPSTLLERAERELEHEPGAHDAQLRSSLGA